MHLKHTTFPVKAHQVQGRSKTLVRGCLIFVLSIVIFLADSFTNFEIATAVLYVSVVLIGAQFLSSRHLWCVSSLCAIMTVVSLAVTPHGNLHSGIINTVLSITAIFATTLMATRMLTAIAAEHEARLQLIHLARVNTLGELSTSIAHEIKQPLTGMASSTSAALNWLSTTPPNIERARSALNRIATDATRTAEIIDRIRRMSRRAAPEFQMINPAFIVQKIVDITQTDLLKNRIALSIHNSAEKALIKADDIQIQQVLINLILNAITAINAADQPHGHIVIAIQNAEKRQVALSVSDNGTGIPDATISHIFEPFHTTREAGTGLGLAICRSIIEAHGGSIHAFCSDKDGTTFRFLFPSFQEFNNV